MAGCEIANGSASSLTVASPSASRARIPRRVESASAANVRSSDSPGFMNPCLVRRLYNVKIIFRVSGTHGGALTRAPRSGYDERVRTIDRRRGAGGVMRAVLFATAIASLAACGGDGDGTPGTIAAVPLAGTIDGQPWTFVAGQTDAFLSDTGDTFFATLFDKPFAAPCDELQPQDATH